MMKTQPAITHSDCWYIMQNTDNQLYKSFSQVSGSNGTYRVQDDGYGNKEYMDGVENIVAVSHFTRREIAGSLWYGW